MREVWKRIAAGDTQAREAMDIYIHRLLKSWVLTPLSWVA